MNGMFASFPDLPQCDPTLFDSISLRPGEQTTGRATQGQAVV
jgi:hypothetical protein